MEKYELQSFLTVLGQGSCPSHPGLEDHVGDGMFPNLITDSDRKKKPGRSHGAKRL